MNLSLPIIARLDSATLKGLSEADFHNAVAAYAKSEGWTCFSIRKTGMMGNDGKWRGMADAGFPDVIACRGNVMLALELKSETGRASPEQTEWLAMLAAVPGVTARLARPRDAAELLKLMEGQR